MRTTRVVRATIRLPLPEEGGRRTPMRTGYHAAVFLRPETPDSGNDALLTMEDREWCWPGEECAVRLTFICPELVQDVLWPGKTFEIREGRRVVARGTITELLDGN